MKTVEEKTGAGVEAGAVVEETEGVAAETVAAWEVIPAVTALASVVCIAAVRSAAVKGAGAGTEGWGGGAVRERYCQLRKLRGPELSSK